jgi:ribosomal protein S18 acetylase RimI-like enzyme
MTFSIRRLGPGDEAVLATIARDAADFDVAGRSETDEPLDPVSAAAYLADPGVLHWVAEHDGVVLGEVLCHLLRLPHGTGRELLLYSIGVREGARRRGVGRALVDAVRRHAADADIAGVWLLADNPGAEAFYAACGFRAGRDDEQGVLYVLDVTGGG